MKAKQEQQQQQKQSDKAKKLSGNVKHACKVALKRNNNNKATTKTTSTVGASVNKTTTNKLNKPQKVAATRALEN